MRKHDYVEGFVIFYNTFSYTMFFAVALAGSAFVNCLLRYGFVQFIFCGRERLSSIVHARGII